MLCLAAIVAMTACGGSKTTDPSGTSSTLTATIDGTSFSSIATIGLHSPAVPGLPNGTVGVSGANKFTLPYVTLAFGVPAVIGTYPLASSNGDPVPQNAAVTNLTSATAGAQWNGGAGFGGTGSITLSTLTATGASGTFSFTLVALPNSGATGTKVVTKGVFNVKF